MYSQCKSQSREVTTVDLSLEETSHRARIHSLKELAPVFEKLDTWMTGFGYAHKDRFAVHLALQEAASNALQHGRGMESDKPVQITLAVRPDLVVVEVEDQGTGFDPATVPNPLLKENRERGRGWGLFMMLAYTSWMTFNAKGNRVTFGRRRSAAK